MKLLRLILVFTILLVGCENTSLSSEDQTLHSKAIPKDETSNKDIRLGVSGVEISSFIKDCEFFGLKKLKPDKGFFVNLAAPGFSIQLGGESPDNVTGAISDISNLNENFYMGKGTIVSFIGLLFNEEDKFEATKWLDKQFVDAELSVRKGLKPSESEFRAENIVITFFPPTSLDDLNATVAIYADDKISKSNNNTIIEKNNSTSKKEGYGFGYNKENVTGNPDDINYLDEYGVSKLARASGNGDVELVKELLSKGADPNLRKDTGEPPLLWAVRSSKDSVVKLLLKAGADPNFVNDEGITPLTIAKEDGANVIIKYLLEYGAKEEAVKK
ncbi:ankyrin repeat domain-containing protein [Bacillus sp. T3]|uniref:ankyrin repeat domain-containing protein n=1 Tax=Bacillus sp. T3 TaxID=467262 RepID=UPI0029818675|nr:ankyrin repeat domain-containing protein [Bacillus sp. T3]